MAAVKKQVLTEVSQTLTDDREGLDSWDKEKLWERFRERRKDQSVQISKAKATKKRRKLSEAERVVHSKVPLELLAREWLSDQNASVEMRRYMVEKLLPTLVIGLEKLLNEVSMRGLEDYKLPSDEFNPINFIAQYLMRNNPRFSNFAEAHPYCRTMRAVSEELKRMAYAIDENRLAELKSKTRLRREERDRDEMMKVAEEKRRRGLIKDAYLQWMLKSEDGLSIGEVKLAVQSWLDNVAVSEHLLASTLPDLFSDLLCKEEGVMREEQFMVDMIAMTADLPTDLFDGLVHHLSVCGVERRSSKLKELRRNLFSNVFSVCDPDQTGMVDRQRVLHLFSLFYDSNQDDAQSKLHNPKKWPIVEVIEDEELGCEEEDLVASTTTTLLSEQEYQEFLAEGEKGAKATSDEGTKEKLADEATVNVKSEQNETSTNKSEEMERKGDEEGKNKEKTDKPASEDTGKGTEPLQDQTVKEDSESGAKKTNSEQMDGEQAETKQAEGSGSRGDQPNKRSALVRKLTSYGNDRAASVSLQRRISGMSSIHSASASGPGHVWDHVMLNCPQFVQLIELFLGPDSEDATVDALSSFIRNNYTETAQERSDRLEMAKQQALQHSRYSRVGTLFEVWDNDRSGYLELEELQLVLTKWHGFSSQQAMEHAENVLTSLGASHKRLTRTQFRVYIDQLTDKMSLMEFEEFSDYLTASVELSFEEKRRGEQRREMLAQIQLAGRTSGLNFQQALKSAVTVIHQDSVDFGGKKEITVGVAVLEPSAKASGTLSLHFKAASPKVESDIVGKKLNQRFKRGVSFQAVDANRPVHVAHIQKHGAVHFFIHDHNREEYRGALVVSPISTPGQQVVGTINVDSLHCYGDESAIDYCFNTHEINFYQGVGVCLGEVFHWINARQKLLLVADSALTWIHRRCPLVTQAAVYIVEPEATPKDHFTLRCMLITSAKEGTIQQNKLLKQGENLFREYLFQCSENSESVSADVYGEHHLAYPIRDHTGCAVAVVDFYMPPAQSLNRAQMRELTRVLKLLTLSFYQLSVLPEQRLSEDSDHLGSTLSLLVGDGSSAELDATVLFDQLLLADLQETMSKLDNRVFAEMRSYVEPPELVLKIIQALLSILRPEREFDTWKECKQGITLGLVKAMESYDPLKVTSHNKLSHIKQLMEAIPADSVKAQGSRPAKLIYSWISICSSLLERSLSMNATESVNSLPDASSSYCPTSARSGVSIAQSANDSETPPPVAMTRVARGTADSPTLQKEPGTATEAKHTDKPAS